LLTAEISCSMSMLTTPFSLIFGVTSGKELLAGEGASSVDPFG
jgi:hypothetical protein